MATEIVETDIDEARGQAIAGILRQLCVPDRRIDFEMRCARDTAADARREQFAIGLGATYIFTMLTTIRHCSAIRLLKGGYFI